jgi:hypothetical protein
MFRKRSPPSTAFVHAYDCKIPLEGRSWRRDPVERDRARSLGAALRLYGRVLARAPPSRRRLDPLDPSTSKHAPECEFGDVTDRSVVKALLKIKPGLMPGYSWVECGSCQCAAGAGLRRGARRVTTNPLPRAYARSRR